MHLPILSTPIDYRIIPTTIYTIYYITYTPVDLYLLRFINFNLIAIENHV